MAKKIVNLTERFGNYPYVAGRKLMVRYVNEDWNYDVVSYINGIIKGHDLNVGYEENVKSAKEILNYWKYKFLLAKGEKRAAMRELKKSFKKGDADAVAQYGYFYYTGQEISGKINKEKAKECFDLALSKKSMFAEYLFAEAITYENDSRGAAEMAIPYYEIALAKGVVFCRYKLAQCYLKTGMDTDKAIELLEKCEEKEAKEKLQELKKTYQGGRK